MTVIEGFVQEAIPPRPHTGGGTGRVGKAWETVLAPLKSEGAAGSEFRIADQFFATTDARNEKGEPMSKVSAGSRRQSIANRLFKTVPNENWFLATRPTTVDGVDGYAIYARFDGMLTPAQVKERAKLKADRAANIKAGKESAETAREAPSAADTPAQRVAAVAKSA